MAVYCSDQVKDVLIELSDKFCHSIMLRRVCKRGVVLLLLLLLLIKFIVRIEP
jgi:hypothetical protein